MSLGLPIILLVTSILAWWLSGYDSKVTGEDKASDLKRRIIRCAITVLLMAVGAGSALSGGKFGGFIYIAIVLPLALIWAGCASELFARGFHNLIDSPGGAETDPKKLTADLDRVAALCAQGRNEEAIELCTQLVKSSDASALAMEAMLFRIYDQVCADERLLVSPALAEVQELRATGQFVEAESRLSQRLKREPGNVGLAMLLLRSYIQDSHCADKAAALLKVLDERSGMPPFFTEYARKRVSQWLAPQSQEEKTTDGIESLLVQKRHGGGPHQAPPHSKSIGE